MRLKQAIKFTALAVAVAAIQSAECAPKEVNFPKSEAIKSIPRPTQGKRWTLIEELSDEFNGTKLDHDKWYDYHPSWQGRPPGLFMSEQISVKDGCLVLESGKLKAGEQVTVKCGYEGHEKTKSFTAIDKFEEGGKGYNVKGAAIVAKSLTAHYDTYYECRVKASKTLMSTTFWLSQHGKHVPTDGRQAEGWDGSYGQELDVVECVGRTGDFAGNEFSKGMHSNAHLWFKDKSVGENLDFRAKSATLVRPDGASPSKDFNVYGCWWVDKSQAVFYLNNEQSKRMDFVVKTTPKGHSQQQGKKFYFTEPMGLNLVMETYTWFYETPPGKSGWNDRIKNEDGSYKLVLPTDEELLDPTKNKNHYDWVRCYKLKDIDKRVDMPQEYVMFENHIHIYEKPEIRGNKLAVNLEYTARKNSDIEFKIYSANGKVLATKVVEALAGYGNNQYEIDLKRAKISKETEYYCVAELRSGGKVFEGDSATFGVE